jgi:hypothetical protein
MEVDPRVRALLKHSVAAVRRSGLQIEEAKRGLETVLDLDEEVVVGSRIDPTEVAVLCLQI